jgi:hypothetical protein
MEMAEAFARAAGARAPMPSIMDLGQAWEPASSSSPSGLPPAGADLQGDPLLEGTTLPRGPARPMGGTILIQDPPRPASSDPPGSGYGHPAPPDRRTSDPMYPGPQGSAPRPPPPNSVPLNALKETQPLTREQMDKVRQATERISTVRMPTAQPGGLGQGGGAPSEPPPWQPPQGPPAGGGGPADAWRGGNGSYAYPERPGTGSYPRPDVGPAPASNPRQGGSGAYPLRDLAAGQGPQPPWGTPPPPPYSGVNPAAPGMEMQQPYGVRSNKVWVLGGLLLGTGFAVLIALIAHLIR